jgi:hypothetical protein
VQWLRQQEKLGGHKGHGGNEWSDSPTALPRTGGP